MGGFWVDLGLRNHFLGVLRAWGGDFEKLFFGPLETPKDRLFGLSDFSWVVRHEGKTCDFGVLGGCWMVDGSEIWA